MEKLTSDFLKEKTIKELVKLRKEQKKSLFDMRMKNTMRALKQTHLIKTARRNIARINTILSNKIKEYNGNNRG